MQWALTRDRIASSALQQTLHKHQKHINAQSALWLSRTQAWGYYRLQCRGGIPVRADTLGERSIFYFTEYTLRERHALLNMHSLPMNKLSKWMLLTSAAGGPPAWTAATLEQYTQASFFAFGENTSETDLLVDATVAVPSSPSHTVIIFNAQETSNPFLIDDTLQHTHFVTGAPFSHVVGSSLSTVWSQFGYTSLKWLPASERNDVKDITVQPGQEPHRVFDLEPVDLVHLCQISNEHQKVILQTVPRWVLLRSLRVPLVLFRGRWLTRRQMNLDEDLKIKRDRAKTDTLKVPERPFSMNTWPAEHPYELWLWCDDSFSYTGLPQRRHIIHNRFFYNSSQLVD
ncbi:hypothetical protein MOQ_009478 [Trypanosoma cruzi marinkellei]|uniref:Uncharacterized protein n=1 Tax=Trypanosoma cruzi marinkellei TaxID=85056 RepID=K2MMB7_TRYCR|nr:hypothetical protein MOQ_009478 [Trypanosoma cruzi marinkellei]